MTILLTGATGFVGQNLIEYLSGLKKDHLSLSRQELAIGDYNKINKADVVIHLAGKAHDLKSTSDPEEYYRVNFELTKELYNTFLRSTAQKFIFISSVKASADQVSGILKEEDLPDPKTHYGKSKLQAERYLKNQTLPTGKSFYILRPCMIHGPGNKGNLNLLYQFVSKGIPYPLAAFENRRSFLSIENLCFVIREIADRTDIPSGVYQVADDGTLSTNDLVRLIASTSGRSSRLWKLSPNLIRALAKLGDRFHLPLTTERLNKLTENYIVSNTKLKSVLKKEFPVSADEGIIHTIRSFQPWSLCRILCK